MSEEDALLKAVIADAGDDTPRLVYADWLDEHDAPIQAEFIRTQCRLASCSIADPEYPELLERAAEVELRFGLALRLTAPQLPSGFKHEREFRRGFPHFAVADWEVDPVPHHEGRVPPGNEQVDRVCAALPDLVANTTVRHLALQRMTPDVLARVLAEPAARVLTGLTVSPVEPDAEGGDALIRVIGRSPVVANLEHLDLATPSTVAGLAALNANPDRFRTLDLPALSGRREDIPALARAAWFRGLRDVFMRRVERPLQGPLLVALAGAPRLESLTVWHLQPTALKALGSATGFPELARLTFEFCDDTGRIAARLAGGRFPRLADLTISGLDDDTFAPLLGARWFPQLHTFDSSGGSLTDASAAALSKSPAAPRLRVLKVWGNWFTKAGLAALGNGARFPALAALTLDLSVGDTRVRPDALARFAAGLSLSRLRYLDLGGWPLGDAGAKALAANPHLANVTRLRLAGCGIGDRGLTALARSRHLQGLLELSVYNNTLKKAAALLVPDRLPRLAALNLDVNPIRPADRAALHRARGWLV
ncbi:hypothetical protein GobsT_01310 [Gemmata obscuriglobus]|nr:TIGR02996 domain-containing protein [Gemmata obscuriglobus]QEG25405.1 hypothetical protein GobsT_01310 [Gemmata obscuriglobus]VTR98480.1 Uncharacterized protein OS=Nitrospina gracilis (strain 3/211) GN=NITGR_780005 PE=4 SV=1: LRR_6: LRR_6 [Gemmata obscuriglobus UQM 2246]